VRPAVEFDVSGRELHLLYSPRDDDQWVTDKFDRGEPLIIKGTYHLTAAHLIPRVHDDDAEFDDEYRLRFRIATLRRDYFRLDPDIVQVGCPVLIHKDARPTWKWFSSERAVSILGVIAQLKPERIVIGGVEPDAIPITSYEK